MPTAKQQIRQIIADNTQIADKVMQLYLCWSPMIGAAGQGIKNTSSRLLESFRRYTIIKEYVLREIHNGISQLTKILYDRWWEKEEKHEEKRKKLSTKKQKME